MKGVFKVLKKLLTLNFLSSWSFSDELFINNTLSPMHTIRVNGYLDYKLIFELFPLSNVI